MFRSIQHGIDTIREQALSKQSSKDQIYIPPLGSYNQVADDNSFDLLEEVKKFISPNAHKSNSGKDERVSKSTDTSTATNSMVLLLTGNAGSGKSTFCQHLFLNLWENFKTGSPIPLLIHMPQLKQPFTSAIEETLENYGFSSQQITELKNNHAIAPIFEAFDELYKFKNISSQLNGWKGNAIVTCRSQALYRINHYQKYFMPFHGERPQPMLFREMQVLPFSENQIKQYLEKSSAFSTNTHNKDEASSNSETPLQKLQSVPGLLELIKTPFFLFIAIQILPDLLRYTEMAQKKSIDLAITQSELYDIFIKNWFNREEEKIKKNKNNETLPLNLSTLFWQYCKQFALCLKQGQLSYLSAPTNNQGGSRLFYQTRAMSQQDLLWKTDNVTALIRSACPLRQVAEGQYAFIHNSLIDYFSSRALYEEGLALTNKDPKTASAPTPAESEVVATSSNTQFSTSQDNFYQKLLTNDINMIGFLADYVKKNETFKNHLLNIVEQSKLTTDEPSAIAAANAITILNKAGYNFSLHDLSKIRIPDADLSYGIFDHTNFDHANLRRVRFTGAWLANASLNQADMADAELGEFPDLTLTKKITTASGPIGAGLPFVVGSGNSIHFYDTDSRQLVKTLEYTPAAARFEVDPSRDILELFADYLQSKQAAECSVTTFCYNPSGQSLAAGYTDGTVIIWDIATGMSSAQFNAHKSGVKKLLYSDQGDFLLSLSNDNVVTVWRDSNKIKEYNCPATILQVQDIEFHSGQQYLLLGGFVIENQHAISSKFVLVDLNTMQIKWSITTSKAPKDTMVGQVICSPDGELWVGIGYDRISMSEYSLTFHYINSGAEAFSLSGTSAPITSMTFSPDSSYFVTASLDRKIYLWDWRVKKLIHIIEGHSAEITHVFFSSDSKNLFAVNANQTIRSWDIASVLQSRQVAKLAHSGVVSHIAFNPQQGIIATGSHDKSIILWNSADGKQIRRLDGYKGHSRWLTGLFFIGSDNLISSGASRGEVIIWTNNWISNKLPFFSKFMPTSITAAFHKKYDSLYLATGSNSDGVYVFNLSKQEALHGDWDKLILQAKASDKIVAYSSVVFSPDNNVLATGSVDSSSIHLFSFPAGHQLHILATPQPFVSDLAFSPDSKLLASVSCLTRSKAVSAGYLMNTQQNDPYANSLNIGNDPFIRIWDCKEGKQVAALGRINHLPSCVAFDPTGEYVASGGWQEVYVWSLKTKQSVAELTGFGGKISSLCWAQSGDDSILIVGSEDMRVRCWKVSPHGSDLRLHLQWCDNQRDLVFKGAKIDSIQNLSASNLALLKQRGAIFTTDTASFEPFSHDIHENNVNDSLNSLSEKIKVPASDVEPSMLEINEQAHSMTLSNAIAKKQLAILQHLLETGANPNSILPNNRPALLQAVDSVQNADDAEGLNIVRALLAAGADPNDGSLALHKAMGKVFSGGYEVAGLLLQHGANVNAQNKTKDTPLLAVCASRPRVMQYFTEPEDDEPDMAVFASATAIIVNMVKLLLKYGADPAITEEHGATPLFVAAADGNEDVVHLLINAGADSRKGLPDGTTPAIIARRKGHLELAKKLETNEFSLNSATTTGNQASTFATAASQAVPINVPRVTPKPVQVMASSSAMTSSASAQPIQHPRLFAEQNRSDGARADFTSTGNLSGVSSSAPSNLQQKIATIQDECRNAFQHYNQDRGRLSKNKEKIEGLLTASNRLKNETDLEAFAKDVKQQITKFIAKKSNIFHTMTREEFNKLGESHRYATLLKKLEDKLPDLSILSSPRI